MRRSNSDNSQGKGRGRGGRRDGRGRGYSNVKPEKRDDSGDGTVYIATVTELALDAPAQGVFATLKASRGRYDGQRCLLRARNQPAVEALRVNDIVRVKCRADRQNRLEGRLCPPRIGTTATGVASSPKKPLLVLDLNGVLCDRGTYASRDAKQKKSINRPHAAQFVRWCYERFEIGVWSCAKRDNMDLSLFEGRDLVMCWDQRKSTSLWPRTSTVSPQKPLFLKEIDQLWASTFDAPRDEDLGVSGDWRRKVEKPAAPKLTRYDAATTVLVDNHLEKFERNPLGSCVLVPTWTASEESDTALALDGDLCRALSQYATGDCQETGKKLAGNGIVPKEHPSPTDDDVRAVQDYVARGCPDGPLHPSLEALASAPAPPPSARAEAPPPPVKAQEAAPPRPPQKSSLERLASQQQQRGGFDASLAKRFADLYCSSRQHKTSCPDWTPRKYLERRDSPGPRARPLKRRDLAMLRSQRWFATEKTDGERHWLWADSDGCRLLSRDLSVARSFGPVPGLAQDTILDGEVVSESNGREFFVAFDAVRCLGEDVGAHPNAPARLKASSRAFELLSDLDGLRVIAKTYYGADFDVLRKTLDTGVFTDGSRSTECDGVVLASYRDNHGYYDAVCFKYKPRVTLDVRLRSAPRIGDIEASVQNGPHDVTVTSVAIDAKALKLLKSVKPPPKGVRGHIVECEYIDGLWRIQRIRTDKKKPNSLRTAWAVLESIADRTTVQDLADALAQAWSQDDNAIEAAAHYDQRQRDRNAGKQLQDQMYRLRRLNNFVKALVLDACCVRRDAVASESCDTASLLRDLRKPGKSRRPERRERRPCAVLELGCGRGGDLGKWRKAVDVTKLVACDISTVALDEARERWEKDGPPPGKFVVGDLGDATLAAKIKGEVGEWKPWADVASCHFALHYACGSPERIDALLDCVATNVKKGGVVVATIIDWLQLRQLLVNGGRIGDLCKVECSDENRTQLLQLPDESSAGHRAWGVEYKFTLGDAVQDCAEFVVHRPSLIARAAAKGLKCTLEARFDCFLDGERRRRGPAFLDLATSVGVRPKHANDDVLSDDQFAVASLYCVVAFSRED